MASNSPTTHFHADKREHLRRAVAFLSDGTDVGLQYAALELRLCLEVMTYEKLESFSKYLPASFVYRTWQPPQLLKAMVQFDQTADKSFTLSIGVESTPGGSPAAMHVIGEHKAFGLTWLRKNYNSLGSHLHASRETSSPEDYSALRGSLQSIADEIAKAQEGTILGSWIGQLAEFKCEVCGEQVVASREFIEKQNSATCQNPACEAEYQAVLKGDGVDIALRAARFSCPGCDALITIEKRHLVDGMTKKCSACAREYVIVCNWQYRPVTGE